jgi:plasmid stabilization system protein ParE
MAKLKIRIDGNADQELKETAKYYNDISPNLSLKFITEVFEAIESLASYPNLFRVRKNNFRAILMSNFPYLIYYRFYKTELIIVAIINSKRSNTFIKKRLK